MTRRLRSLVGPFVVAAPAAAAVRTRLRLSDDDEGVLVALGAHLGALAGRDLAWRCREGQLGARGRAVSRRERKRALTAECSSRWAGAITRGSEDAWQLAHRNLLAEGRSLRARIGRIRARLAVGVGERRGRQRGYASGHERFEKQRRLQILERRLGEVEGRLADARVSICRGGRRLARTRQQLEAAGIGEVAWRERWVASRLFLTADGEGDKAWGNETIRFHPDEEWLEIKLPAALAHLANRPHSRYRLSCPVGFPYRGDEVAAQAASGAIRYDLSPDPGKDRWYLGASWKTAQRDTPTLEELRGHPVLAVDLNAGHLAALAVEASGSPLGVPVTIPLELGGLPTSTRDGRVRAAISELLRLATTHGAAAIVIEDLDFADAREQGRERRDRRPSRGQRGRSFRRAVAGIPTRRFRDRLVQMATNQGLAVVAVDPAYTSRWGAQYWLGALQQISPVASGHHAAALVIARRGLGQRARRRERCDSTPPEDGQERATNSAMRATPAQADLSQPRHRDPGNRKARGQPHQRHKTQRGERPIPGDQAAQDRSGPPAEQDSLLLSG